MDKKVEQHLKICRKYLEWDPKKNSFDDKVSVYDADNLHKAMQKMLSDCWGINKELDDVKLLPFFNILFVAYGFADPKQITKIMSQAKDARGRYLSVIDPVPEFIKASEDVTKKFYELKPGSNEYDFNGMKLKELDEDSAHYTVLSSTLKANGMPAWNNILHVLEGIPKEMEEAISAKEDALTVLSSVQAELDRIKPTLAELQLRVDQGFEPMEIEGDGTIPNGRYVLKKISELFPDIQGPRGGTAKFDKDWEVPCWEWDGPHPDVPKRDPHYIFRKAELVPVLYALLTNQRAWLQGHTGSGKTTLIEQVAAALNWPFIRINFDSEITRMDLIGRDTLKTVDGETVSQFVDGILPRAMQSAAIVCFDELDFVRPDVAYVMQAATEGNGMRITEDGDRYIKPHPMFRMFATGNTVGQGDEEGMYQGARPQSLAFLDRFAIWVTVDYLSDAQRRDLVTRHYPSLSEDELNAICLYTQEHLAAFKEGNVTQPISPRGMLAIAKATMMLGDVKEAVQFTMLNRANSGDRNTLRGIVDRVFK